MPTTFWVYDPSKPSLFKALSIILLVLVCCCGGLLFHMIADGTLNRAGSMSVVPAVMTLFIITVGAYIIILAVDVITQTFGYPLSRPPILVFMVVGVVLFFTSGIMAMIKAIERVNYKKHNTSRVICFLLFAILCIVIGILMAIYIFGVFFYERKKYTLKNQEYRFDNVIEDLQKGDVILHLVNPHHTLWTDKTDKTRSKPVEVKESKIVRSTPEQKETYNVQTMQLYNQEEKIPLEQLYTRSEQKILIHPKQTDDYILTQAGKLMDRPAQDMVGESVRTSDLELTDSTEITSLKGKFYLVKGKTPEALGVTQSGEFEKSADSMKKYDGN